jgi:hypothetical protein
MVQLIERLCNWRIAASDVDGSAHFEPLEWRHASVDGPKALEVDPIELSACIELIQFGGGLSPRALLGGTFISGGNDLVFEVGSTGPMTLGAVRRCRSLLGRPLVSGLPAEFVELM